MRTGRGEAAHRGFDGKRERREWDGGPGQRRAQEASGGSESGQWSLTSLCEKLVKIGAKVVAHARYTVSRMAEVAVPQHLFRGILDRIDEFRPCHAARC